MTEIISAAALAILQPEPPRITTNAISFSVTTGLVLIVFIIMLYFIFKALRKKRDHSITAELREEFDKSKEALLLAAQQKKAAVEETSKEAQADDRQATEIELLKENVDPARVFGNNCPLSGLEMMDDQELVIDPHTGQGYHFSSFLNDWPQGRDRPQYIYRYPQGTVMKSEDLLRNF